MNAPCKRGNIAPRSKSGHCQCADCKAYRKEWYAKTSAARAANKREWHAKNPGKASEYSRRWVKNNPEQRRETVEAWRKRNPESVAAYSAKAGRKWSQKNKSKRLASVRARQIAKICRTPEWVDKAAIAAFYEAAADLTRATGVAHEVDHIIPLQGENVSGLHVPWNLQVLTRTENRSKGNRYDV